MMMIGPLHTLIKNWKPYGLNLQFNIYSQSPTYCVERQPVANSCFPMISSNEEVSRWKFEPIGLIKVYMYYYLHSNDKIQCK